MITARLTYRLRLAGAVVLALVTTAGAIVLAVALSGPTSDFATGFPLTAVSEARAEAAAEASPPDLQSVEAATRRTLEIKPGDSSAWCRLAWVAAQQGRRPEMLDALDRSYAVAPFGPDITAWRLRFIYEQWADMTPDLRRQASAELAVATRDRPGLVAAAEIDIHDPTGRLAFILTRRNATLRAAVS